MEGAAGPAAAGVATPPVGDATTPGDVELLLRDQLSRLRGLLALSMLMTERRQEDEIVHLVVTAIPSLVSAEPLAVLLVDGRTSRWVATAGPFLAAGARADAAARLGRLPPPGGPVEVHGTAWAWGFALLSLGERLGHLVVGADREPPAADLLLLRSMAQQAGTALSNARLHARNRSANAELARTVEVLRDKTAIHDRFTQEALTGTGQQGIVAALHELTGLPACLEDRSGDVLAWAGPGAPPPSRPTSARRERVVSRALRAGHPIRIDGRLLIAARPRADVVGVLCLLDPDGVAGEQQTVALEHAATVLAIELARLHSVAETELRLGRDLLSDLLAGAGEETLQRARALGHDLNRPHRVLAVSPGRGRAHPQDTLTRVSAALAPGGRSPSAVDGAGPKPLLLQSGTVVIGLLPAVDLDAERLTRLGVAIGSSGRVGVGGTGHGPGDVPRSHREAQLALRLAQTGTTGEQVRRYDDLGVYQFLAQAADVGSLDSFIRRWIGALVDYDHRRGTDLVATLAAFLDCGGHYDATAGALAVGRSTVRYRLRRIREITGHDLTDADTRFQLMFATRAWATRCTLSDSGPFGGAARGAGPVDAARAAGPVVVHGGPGRESGGPIGDTGDADAAR